MGLGNATHRHLSEVTLPRAHVELGDLMFGFLGFGLICSLFHPAPYSSLQVVGDYSVPFTILRIRRAWLLFHFYVG